jgi:hypothetical protein
MIRLARAKWEIVAQRLALGDTQTEAYLKAGYKSKNPSSDACSLLRRHPEIVARSKELSELAFDRQTDRQLVCRTDVLEGLLENIKEAKQGSPVYDKQGELVGWKREFGAINQAFKLIADIEGLIVRRSEQRTHEGDPVASAGAAELIQLIDGAFTKLGFDFDITQLSEVFGGAEEAGSSGNGHDEVPAEVLPALSEAAGVSRGGVEVPVSTADGGEPGWEVGGGFGGSLDALDGSLPGDLEGEEVQ